MRKTIEQKEAVRDEYRNERVRARAHQLMEGDLVLKKKPSDKVKHKFDTRFDGPYRVKSVDAPNVTIQKLHERARPITLHMDQVKPFKTSITLPIYASCRDAPDDADGKGQDALTNAEKHAEAADAVTENGELESVCGVRILPPSRHPITIVARGYWKDINDPSGRVLIFCGNGLEGRSRICAMDPDGTIIKTRSGAIFPKETDDWTFWNDNVRDQLRRMHNCDFKLCVFSNQAGIQKGVVNLDSLKARIENVCEAAGKPMQFFIALSDGYYRKPNIGMWKLLQESENDFEEVSPEHSFYVGDAAGREASGSSQADFSDSDLLFAANAGLSFFTPDHFFQESPRQKSAPEAASSRIPPVLLEAETSKQPSSRTYEDAWRVRSNELNSPLTGQDWSKLMKVLDEAKGRLVQRAAVEDMSEQMIQTVVSTCNYPCRCLEG